MRTILLHLVIIFMFIYSASGTNTDPIVKTPYGLIGGKFAKSYSGRRYAEYGSVPYAQPPIQDLRFKEPQPLKPWKGIWQANFTTQCAQLMHYAKTKGKYIGQEDCLYLSIYVPEVKSTKGLDIIFDIHGGGFNFGYSTEYTHPSYLMDKDIIFVAVNYRLGVLGFLSTEDEVVPGNNGMKDQVQAITWVKDNIKYFGGNPDSITLSGLSAGGASVHLHYFSPLSKGLFKGGISVSGNALCPWVMQENPLKKAQEIGASVGCTQKSTLELVECLTKRSVTQLVENMRIHRPWLYNPFSPFGVVVEKFGDNPFLPEHPYALITKGELQDLPWLTSTVKHEGLYPVADFILATEYLEELEKRFNDLIPLVLHYEETISPDQLSAVSNKIKQFYFKDEPVNLDTSLKLTQMASDRLFLVDADKSVRLQAKANKSPTYYYYFTYESENAYSFTQMLEPNTTRIGVCHGDDLAFLFPLAHHAHKKLTPKDEKMKNTLLNMWITFAKTSVPKVDGVEWNPITSNLDAPINYLHIKSPDIIKMKQVNIIGNRPFWDSLPFKENDQLFKTHKTEL